MNKKLIVLIIVIFILAIALGVYLGLNFKFQKAEFSPFSVVYLSTGDVYFGKLDFFPWPRLENAWLTAKTNDPKTPLRLVPFESSFYSPSGEIYLNPKAIVFWSRLRADSQVAQAISNPEAFKAQNLSGANSAVNLPTSTAK